MYYQKISICEKREEKKRLIVKSIKFEEDFLGQISESANKENMNFSDFTKRALMNEIKRVSNADVKSDNFSAGYEIKGKLSIINRLLEESNVKGEKKSRIEKELSDIWHMLN